MRRAMLAVRDTCDPSLGALLARHVLERCQFPDAVPIAGFWPMGLEIDIRPLLAALADVGLERLAPRLDAAEDWRRVLSGGEQQRLAFARALLQRPAWLFLDEATASLDTAAEARLHELLRERLPGTAVVSIAHRPALAAFHDRTLRLEEGRLVPA